MTDDELMERIDENPSLFYEAMMKADHREVLFQLDNLTDVGRYFHSLILNIYEQES